MNNQTNETMGKLSIGFCILGFIIPPIIHAIGFPFIEPDPYNRNIGAFRQSCAVISMGFLASAIVLGFAGRKERLARVGLIFAFITLPLMFIVSIAP
ncbi:MAG: hypothetical protein AAFX46_10075 [Cyanobacteria bacterium J06636_27]